MYERASQSPSRRHRYKRSGGNITGDGSRECILRSRRRHRHHRKRRSSSSSSDDSDSASRKNTQSTPAYVPKLACRSRSPENTGGRKRNFEHYLDKYNEESKQTRERSETHDKNNKERKHTIRHEHAHSRENRPKYHPESRGQRSTEGRHVAEDAKAQQTSRPLDLSANAVPTQPFTGSEGLILNAIGGRTDVNLGMLNNEFNQVNYARAYGIDITNFAVLQPDILKVDLPRETKQLSTHEKRQRYKEETLNHPDRFWRCKTFGTMEVPFRLPAVIKHTSSESYMCAAVSVDGRTIALGSDERITLFPSYSPRLPCEIMKYNPVIDRYNREVQAKECMTEGDCDVCTYFAGIVAEQSNTERAIMHMTFFGDDDYLLVVGNGTISIYELEAKGDGPIITACFDSALETEGKVCFYPISLERSTVMSEHAGVIGLSCLEFIINNKKMEMNYYRIIFNEEERWWFLDCTSPIDIMADIDDEGIQTHHENAYKEVSEGPSTVEYVSAQQYMDMEDINRVPDEGFYIVEDMGVPVGKNLTQTKSSHYTSRSWYGSSAPKMRHLKTVGQDDECGASMGNTVPPWIGAPDTESDILDGSDPNNMGTYGPVDESKQPAAPPKEDKAGDVQDKILVEPPNKGGGDDVTPNVTEVPESSEKKGDSSVYDLLRYYTDPDKCFAAKRPKVDSTGEGKVQGDTDSIKPCTESIKTARSESRRHEIESYKKLHFEKSMLKSNSPILKRQPDPELEYELWVEKNQKPVVQSNAGETYLIFCVLTKSISNQEVGRAIVTNCPNTDDTDLDESGSDDESLEERNVEIEYERNFIVAVSYRFGYIGLLKIRVPYSSLISGKGDVLVVTSGEPIVEFVYKFQFATALNVENMLYSGDKDSFLAILGGDATVILRCPLPEVQYNFAGQKVDKGIVSIKPDIALNKFEIRLLFRYHEQTFNAMHRIGCFGYCDRQWVFVTNTNTGLKVFGTKEDSNNRYLRLSLRYDTHIGLVDAMWINNTMTILVLMDDGCFAIMEPTRYEQWFGLIPNFMRINRNMEYVEDEGEFDRKPPLHSSIDRPIDYDKMEETHDYKFFQTSQYALFGDESNASSFEMGCYNKPVIHSETMLDEFSSRLAIE